MRLIFQIIAVCSIVIILAGCAKEDGANSTTKQESAAVSSTVKLTEEGLPIWAPEDLSPEFLRAAKILKPLPEEMALHPAMEIALYELFGTLTDEQIEKFKQERTVSRPMNEYSEQVAEIFKERYGAQEIDGNLTYTSRLVDLKYSELTEQQLEVFSRIVAAWKEAHKGDPEREDFLVYLYELGADEELSNVHICMAAMGHVVDCRFHAFVYGEDGKYVSGKGFSNEFAQF